MNSTTQPNQTKDTIEFADFLKLDLRVGRVLTATIPDWSEKLIELKVDLGPEWGERTILAGVKDWVEPAELEGKNFIFLANLAEKKMGPAASQGMMLAADDGQRAVLLPVSDKLEPGTIIR